jgi:hypothetical protein
MKLRFLLVFALLLIPSLALAQDEPVGLTGTYNYEGSSGDTTYTGSVTLSGTGPIYVASYVDMAGTAEEDAGEALALAQGEVVVAAFGESCSPATLVRQSNGLLFGTWNDSANPAVTALGLEFGVPQAETTDFAGTYDIVGSYADGSQYTAVVTITENEGGWYDLVYSYTSDETSEDQAGEEMGIGIAVGNVLGYAYTAEDSPCEPYVLDLSGGMYSGYYMDDELGVATETGARAE